MPDALHTEAELVGALKLTASPPQAWIEVAALLPSTLGDLDRIERAVASAQFRQRFARDPHDAISQAGMEPSAQLVEALRARFT
jgi:hypothetical protein